VTDGVGDGVDDGMAVRVGVTGAMTAILRKTGSLKLLRLSVDMTQLLT
jgi:hypothetical protein